MNGTVPVLPKFKATKEESTMRPLEKIAKFIEGVLFHTDNAKFAEAEWNIAEESHQKE